jgi:hypothetical protein
MLAERDHDRVDRMALQGEVAALPIIGSQGDGHVLGDEDLTGSRLGGEVRGDVRRVAQRGELVRRATRDDADERRAGVDAGPEREPRSSPDP